MTGEFQGKQSHYNQVGMNVQSLIRQDQAGNQIVSQSWPPHTDLAISRKIFTANALTGTHAAPAVAPLTTNAQHILFNSGSAKLIIPLLAWVVLESGTRALGTSVWVAVSAAEESTAPTEYTNSSGTISVGGGASGDGLYDNVITLGTAPGWVCYFSEATTAAVHESWAQVLRFRGEFVVQPKHNFVMSIRDSAAGTTPLYSAGFMWAEVPAVMS